MVCYYCGKTAGDPFQCASCYNNPMDPSRTLMSSSSERIAVEKNVGHRKDDMSGGGLRLDIPSSNQAPADTVASSMTPNRNQLQDTSSAGTGEGGLDYAFSNSSTHPIRQSTMPTQLRRIVTPVRSATGSVWVTHTDNAHELAPPYYYPVVPATSPQMNYEEWCAAAADLNPVALSAAASPAMMSSVADQQDVGQQVDSHVGCIDPALIAQDRVGGASLEQANCSSSYGDRCVLVLDYRRLDVHVGPAGHCHTLVRLLPPS
ncbi:uncharacterized protein B0H18DRAFT_594413 [Fomitopsis serialis]|uniref:uncharacterized protein n=1 Tax=Fomitopsis serialis TaxID=139415 RepID=UPI0020072848|nr:uncharacterized protein B0H18DRAFT_594413 [Neoantrodia serialis]KAH9920486.1 hypothetical protein B0H18DRAFT_594413 [Neoantrodia serialis]